MTATALTQAQLYQQLITELQNLDTDVTDDSPGSIVDVVAGVVSTIMAQMMSLTVAEYGKTYFNSANGPEVTGGVDDLEYLATDHFGNSFARPAAAKATGSVTFSRSASAAAVTIPAGTELSTAIDANGNRTRFVTTQTVDMEIGETSVAAAVQAVVGGTAGNVTSGKITNIESSLTDSSVAVTNAAAMAGGTNTETDAQYRETIRNLLQSLKGATLSAIESTAKAVTGVTYATAIESELPVIEYDIGGEDIAAGAEFFRIPRVFVYVADADGASSTALVALAQTAINGVRAAGVKVTAAGASAVSLNWTASITLDAGGPNFAALSASATLITDSMKEYIRGIGIGSGFNVATANAAILAQWGSAGTGDITAFTTNTPIGNVDVDTTEKLIPGTVTVSSS